MGRFLCIGGPADGRRVPAYEYQPGIPVPVYRHREMREDRSVRDTTYVAQQLRDQEGKDFWVYALEGLNVVEELILGYSRQRYFKG